MKARYFILMLAASSLGAWSTSPAAAEELYVNGRIYTRSGWQQAMQIDKGRVTALGTTAALRARQKKGATVVDLGGRTVMPGLTDMHVHPDKAVEQADDCSILPGASADAFFVGVTTCVRKKTAGQWIRGGQWVAAIIGTAKLNKDTLDKIAPNNPVFLLDQSYHTAWVNTKALEAAGINRDTPNPVGGVIERDAAGNATGILRENAKNLLLALIPDPSPTEKAATLKRALATLTSYGITSITDAMVSAASLAGYDRLSDEGGLKVHVLGCIVYTEPKLEAILKNRQIYRRPNFSPDCVKVFADGVPTDSHTSAMIDPYPHAAGNADDHGLLMIDPAALTPKVVEWDKAGLTVKFHATGDMAVRKVLDMIAAARQANGPGGPRHMIAHANFVERSDILRAKALGATWEFSPYVWFPNPVMSDVEKAIGPERMKRFTPIREAIESGALVVTGSDWPVVPLPNPWIALETAVTRQAPGGSTEMIAPDERVTLAQAIDLFTVNAARTLGVEKDRGSIDVGKLADFIILDRDPLAIPITDVHNVQVLATYIDGEEVYRRTGETVTNPAR